MNYRHANQVWSRRVDVFPSVMRPSQIHSLGGRPPQGGPTYGRRIPNSSLSVISSSARRSPPRSPGADSPSVRVRTPWSEGREGGSTPETWPTKLVWSAGWNLRPHCSDLLAGLRPLSYAVPGNMCLCASENGVTALQ